MFISKTRAVVHSLIILILLSASTLAEGRQRTLGVGAPLFVDASTVALWNFDLDTDNQVVLDLAENPVSGAAYSTVLVDRMPGLEGFGKARQFTGSNSFIDFGETAGSKFDFANRESAAIEALIELTSAPSGMHMVFDNGQLQLGIIANQLVGAVAQTGGYKGVFASETLALNVPYRIVVSLNHGRLGLFLNGRSVGNVPVSEPIANNPNPRQHTFVGGNVFSQYFPGFIDDVRLSNSARYDVEAPSVTLVSPSQAETMTDPFPEFHVSYSDNSGIDVQSVGVYLNGRVQSGYQFDDSGITGRLSDPLLTGRVNELKVAVSDQLGNVAVALFYFTFVRHGAGTEYQPDADTLALWHMNEASPNVMPDSSGHGYDGYGKGQIGRGVFGRGRIFTECCGNQMTIPMVAIPDHRFTYETWIRPDRNHDSGGSEEILFETGQIKIARYLNGFVRVVLKMVRNPKTLETTALVLPLGELHHLAVVWDGSLPENQLVLYRDGVIQQVFDAPGNCDFDNTPVAGAIGTNFTGMLDEMRLSSVVRDSFNLISTQNAIDFKTLPIGSSTNQANPELHVQVNSPTPIDAGKIHVRLNGREQLPGAALVITGESIDGVMSDALQEGLNTIEVDVVNAAGDQILEKHHFFYIRNSGGGAYGADDSTIGLWHFEEPQGDILTDSSGKGYDLVTSWYQPSVEPGKIGFGRRLQEVGVDTLRMRSRSFTVEGWVQAPTGQDSARPFLLNGCFYTEVNLLPEGAVRLYLQSQDGTIDQRFSAVLPVDGAFHHLALVYDGKREYAQLLLLVDGAVKASLDYKMLCDCTDTMQFKIGSGYSPVVVDEFRVSKQARYAFNLGGASSQPVIDSISPAPEQTVQSSSQVVDFSFHGDQPLNRDKTYLLVNGVRSSLTLTMVGRTGSLQGRVNLNPGANLMELHIVDMVGSEQVKPYIVYLIEQGPAESYVDDPKTLLLLHLDEASGTILTDSSSHLSDLSIKSAVDFAKSGVFGSTTVESRRQEWAWARGPITPLGTKTQLTAEAWVILSSDIYGSLLNIASREDMGENQFLISCTGATCGVRWSNSGRTYELQSNLFPQDSQYHHVAAILDSEAPYRNVLLVLDGRVVKSVKMRKSVVGISSSSPTTWAQLDGYARTDEIRFSDTARYTLNSKATQSFWGKVKAFPIVKRFFQ